MSTSSISKIIAGPCVVAFKGKTFLSQGDVEVDFTLDTFTVDSDAYGPGTPRRTASGIKVHFIPTGQFDAISVLWPYGKFVFGDFITPVRTFESFDSSADTATITAFDLRDGVPVRVTNDGGALPAGLVAGTLYYVHVIDANTLSFHTTEAAALAGTGKIDLTTVGTGVSKLVEQEPLVIYGFDKQILTLPVAAVTKMPDFSGISNKTIIGDVEFEGFKIDGQDITADGSLFTLTSGNPPAFTYDDADIITQPYTISWGASPWDAVETKAGTVLSFPLTLTEVGSETWKVKTRKITGVGVQVKAQPSNISLSALMTAFQLQGASAVPGTRMTGTDLNVFATGVYARVYGAALISGGAAWSSKNDRQKELQWSASRTWTANVANPLFFIGSAAPA